MTIFDQRGQQVAHQYNAAGNINLDAGRSAADLVPELEKLRAEIREALAAGTLAEEAGTDAEYQITKALQEAKKPAPNKNGILERLHTAQSVLVEVTAVSTAASHLLPTIAQAAEIVQRLFR